LKLNVTTPGTLGVAVRVTGCPATAGDGLAVMVVVVAVSAQATAGTSSATSATARAMADLGRGRRRDDMRGFSWRCGRNRPRGRASRYTRNVISNTCSRISAIPLLVRECE
jgi:hypothetical protein